MPHASTLTAEYSSYRPIGSRVLLKRIEEEDKSGDIYLPENRLKTGMIECVVKAVGSKVEHFEKGDHALIHRQLSFNKVVLAGEQFDIVPEDQLVAKLSHE